MRIVVCEDEPFYQTAIAEAIERWQSASGHTDVELSVFSSSEDVLEAIEHEAEIDLLFVDIQIPGEMSGIDLARRIREACLDMTIVFCTNMSLRDTPSMPFDTSRSPSRRRISITAAAMSITGLPFGTITR